MFIENICHKTYDPLANGSHQRTNFDCYKYLTFSRSKIPKLNDIVGERRPDEKAGRASGLRAEAFFRLAFLDTFLAMQKVSKKKRKKKPNTCWCRCAKTHNKGGKKTMTKE